LYNSSSNYFHILSNEEAYLNHCRMSIQNMFPLIGAFFFMISVPTSTIPKRKKDKPIERKYLWLVLCPFLFETLCNENKLPDGLKNKKRSSCLFAGGA